MIGLHFLKSPQVVVLISLLDQDDQLTHQWTASTPYTVGVEHGSCLVNGSLVTAPGFIDSILPGTPVVLIGQEAGTQVSFYFITAEIEADLNVVGLGSREYAGKWQETLARDWLQATVSLSDLQALAATGIADDTAWKQGMGMP